MVALNFALPFSIPMNLRGVMMFDRLEERAQHRDELGGGRIGEPR
jgi:aromatic ring hydroxylase